MVPNLSDEIGCENFFDQIDDLIEFPPVDECGDGNIVRSNECKDFPTWDPLFSGGNVDAASDLSTELSVPYEDIVQLEWLSTFMEDSFSGEGLMLRKENLRLNESSPNQFQTASPNSVLESSSSSSSSTSFVGPQRARSKRPRPVTFNPRPAIQLNHRFFSESNIFAESPPVKKFQKPEQKNHKKIKLTLSADPNATHYDPPAQAIRKCLHCEITKTPQWRAGPMGPKTLCNACGVRYNSGRLFPEYRPAASPTFVPSVHSNSHRKVLEMRSKTEPGIAEEPEIVPTASPL